MTPNGRKFTHGSLFSGIGGFDIAAEWMGWTNVFHCEINPFGQRILKHYWPNAISYTDITKTDFSIHRGGIDILTGGFPCQPFSTAGKRKGTEDDRHLWPEMLRAIREIQPRYIVGENVRGITNWNGGLVFDQVQADLEAEGFEVLPFLLPACAVNAPHRRDRIWFVAHACGTGGIQYGGSISNVNRNDTKQEQGRERQPNGIVRSIASHPDNLRIGEQDKSPEQQGRAETGTASEKFIVNTSNAGRKRFQKRNDQPNRKQTQSITKRPNRFGGWQDFPTQPPVCNGDDGLSGRLDAITFPKWRKESLTGGGNAVVPVLVYQIFQSLHHITK